MTTAVLAVMSLGGVLSAVAETDIYKDIRMPNGHARSMAAKRADIRACGAANGVSEQDFARANECMRAHGWVVDHVVPDPPHRGDKGTVVNFDDLKKKPNKAARGEAVLQTDTRRCAGRTRADYESEEFKQCMLGRGWQFTYTKHAPVSSSGHEQTWKEVDDSGVLLTCRGILGGFGSVCTNF
jgi:hypothetical protein